MNVTNSVAVNSALNPDNFEQYLSYYWADMVKCNKEYDVKIKVLALSQEELREFENILVNNDYNPNFDTLEKSGFNIDLEKAKELGALKKKYDTVRSYVKEIMKYKQTLTEQKKIKPEENVKKTRKKKKKKKKTKMSRRMIEEKRREIDQFLKFQTKIKKMTNRSGAISEVSVVDPFVKEMKRADTERKKTHLLEIIFVTHDELILREIVVRNGVNYIQMWLKDFDSDLIHVKILRILKRLPMTIDVLKKTSIGKVINKLSHSTNNRDVKSYTEKLIGHWKKLIKKEKQQKNNSRSSPASPPTPNGSIGGGFRSTDLLKKKAPTFKPIARKKSLSATSPSASSSEMRHFLPKKRKRFRSEDGRDSLLNSNSSQYKSKKSIIHEGKRGVDGQPPKKKRKRVSWARNLITVHEFQTDGDGVKRKFVSLVDLRRKEREMYMKGYGRGGKKRGGGEGNMKDERLLRKPQIKWYTPLKIEDSLFSLVNTEEKIFRDSVVIPNDFQLQQTRTTPKSPKRDEDEDEPSLKKASSVINQYPFNSVILSNTSNPMGPTGGTVSSNNKNVDVGGPKEDDVQFTSDELDEILSLLKPGDLGELTTISKESNNSILNQNQGENVNHSNQTLHIPPPPPNGGNITTNRNVPNIPPPPMPRTNSMNPPFLPPQILPQTSQHPPPHGMFGYPPPPHQYPGPQGVHHVPQPHHPQPHLPQHPPMGFPPNMYPPMGFPPQAIPQMMFPPNQIPNQFPPPSLPIQQQQPQQLHILQMNQGKPNVGEVKQGRAWQYHPKKKKCRFYGTSDGCRHGNDCSFAHYIL